MKRYLCQLIGLLALSAFLGPLTSAEGDTQLSTCQAGSTADRQCSTVNPSLKPSGKKPEPAAGEDSTPGSSSAGSENTQRPKTSSSAEAANSYASTVSTMTGLDTDSQGHMQNTARNMTTSGASSSREVGSLDILEALLLLPFNPNRAARLFTSGQQAHDAAVRLDAVSARANQYAGLMQGTQILGTSKTGTQGSSDSGEEQPNSPNVAGSSSAVANAPSDARSGELYGQLESKYGLERNDFEKEVNYLKGDPEAVGAFLQDATGDKAVGKEAVIAALDHYALELGITGTELRGAHLPAIPEFAKARAAPNAPIATPNIPKMDLATPNTERKLAAATAKEKKESLR